MKIKTEEIKEIDYNELFTLDQNVRVGDLLLIKKSSSEKWIVQFITMITFMGIYLHTNSDGLDGGGVILWPEYLKKSNIDIKNKYNDTKFIHIPIV